MRSRLKKSACLIVIAKPLCIIEAARMWGLPARMPEGLPIGSMTTICGAVCSPVARRRNRLTSRLRTNRKPLRRTAIGSRFDRRCHRFGVEAEHRPGALLGEGLFTQPHVLDGCLVELMCDAVARGTSRPLRQCAVDEQICALSSIAPPTKSSEPYTRAACSSALPRIRSDLGQPFLGVATGVVVLPSKS
jgi:hypothetical protein